MFYLILGLIFLIGILFFFKNSNKSKTQLYLYYFNLKYFLFFLILIGYFLIRGNLGVIVFFIFLALIFILAKLGFRWIKKNKERSSETHSLKMSRKKALEILGLKEGADRETIQKSHRELLKRVHPDRGGSNYLAAMINEARNVLLPD